jgi:trehalose utilization protein
MARRLATNDYIERVKTCLQRPQAGSSLRAADSSMITTHWGTHSAATVDDPFVSRKQRRLITGSEETGVINEDEVVALWEMRWRGLGTLCTRG